MSIGAKIVVLVMRAVKKTIRTKGPAENIDEEVRKAKLYNQKHSYKEPEDKKAFYQTVQIAGCPCLIIRQQDRPSDKAILFLHGGGDRDSWKPEVAFARTYGKKAGMDVYYPLYPPFTEVSPADTADIIFEVYRSVVEKYGADKTAVIGGSYGGFLALQLLTMINRNNSVEGAEHVEMPRLMIMNSPFAYPKTEEEWRYAEELEKDDVMLPVGAFRYMFGATMKTAPDIPDYLLYPADMDFRCAPPTYIFYAQEACSAVADAIELRFKQDGSGEQLHMHKEPGMMHCYASAPVFKESKRDFNKQIALLKR